MGSDNKREFNRQISASHGSFELVLGPLFFALFGLFLDRRFGFTPVLTVLGAIVGVVAVAITMYYRYQASMAALAQGTEAGGNAQPKQSAA